MLQGEDSLGLLCWLRSLPALLTAASLLMPAAGLFRPLKLIRAAGGRCAPGALPSLLLPEACGISSMPGCSGCCGRGDCSAGDGNAAGCCC
jgi:hypothetical protein